MGEITPINEGFTWVPPGMFLEINSDRGLAQEKKYLGPILVAKSWNFLR